MTRKVLYVDAHVHSLNPTNTLTPAMVAVAGDTTFFGPGYVGADEVEAGLARFVDRTGPYDAVVVGPNVPVFTRTDAERAHSAGAQIKFNALTSKPQLLTRFFADVTATLAKLPVDLRLLSLHTLDYYATTPDQIERIEEYGAVIIAPDAAFAPKLAELPAWAREEKHFVRKAESLSDVWTEFVTRHPERVVTVLHFVAESEFSFRGLAERRHRVAVPGVKYVLRDRAVQVLNKAGIKPASSLTFDVFRGLNKIGLPIFRKFLPLKLFNLTFFETLLDTRFVYTARGGFGIPVRKFFEIPAAGAVMLCVPPLGFPHLGFKDGVHYVDVEPDALPEALRALEKDLDRAQSIARNGQQLILSRHSLRARAEQFALCLEALHRRSYAGAHWVDGEFELKVQNNVRAASDGRR